MLLLERALIYFQNIIWIILQILQNTCERVLKEFTTFSTIIIIIHSENKHFKIMYNKAASIPVKIYGKTAAFYTRMIISKDLHVLSLLYSD